MAAVVATAAILGVPALVWTLVYIALGQVIDDTGDGL
jgi:hypothetical protein